MTCGHTKTPTLERLWQAVRDDYKDWTTRLVFADALEEAGEDVLANAQRWMVRGKKQPTKMLVSGKWHWCYGPGPGENMESIGRLLMQAMNPTKIVLVDTVFILKFDTREEAEGALAKGLVELGIWVRGDGVRL